MAEAQQEPEPEPVVEVPVEEEVKEVAPVDNKPDEPLYQRPLVNRVVVSSFRPLNFYVDRSRRILRIEDELQVNGYGRTVSMACTLVEVLKRQQIAVVESVSTGMDVQPVVNRRIRDYQWTRPVTRITFVLKRGALADCVHDYHQRKVIEIFENNVDGLKGALSKQAVLALKFEDNFFATEEQKQSAAAFLEGIQGDEVRLPDFIRYVSRLIHPLLRDKKFKEQLREFYGLADQRKGNAKPDAEAEDAAVAVAADEAQE